MPYPVQIQMVRRTRELNNQVEHNQEIKHGFRGNVVNLDVDHNRSYLLDALRLPLISFQSKLRNLKSRMTILKFKSCVTHRSYMMQVIHRSGMPSSQRYQQEDHLQHLDNAIRYDQHICIPSRTDDNLLYSLTGKLYHSIGKSFNQRETLNLIVMRNALARMFVQHV